MRRGNRLSEIMMEGAEKRMETKLRPRDERVVQSG